VPQRPRKGRHIHVQWIFSAFLIPSVSSSGRPNFKECITLNAIIRRTVIYECSIVLSQHLRYGVKENNKKPGFRKAPRDAAVIMIILIWCDSFLHALVIVLPFCCWQCAFNLYLNFAAWSEKYTCSFLWHLWKVYSTITASRKCHHVCYQWQRGRSCDLTPTV